MAFSPVHSRFHGPLACIFFAEFDMLAGPQITVKVPDQSINQPASRSINPAVFDALKPFLIVSPELSHRIMSCTVNVNPSTNCQSSNASHCHWAVLVPVSLSNQKYARNSLHFSIGFVFENQNQPNNHTDAQSINQSINQSRRALPYMKLVSKLARYLETLEIESECISQISTIKQSINQSNGQPINQSQNNGDCIENQSNNQSTSPNRSNLQSLLSHIFLQLSREGQCSVKANESNQIFLRLEPLIDYDQMIERWHVPVLINQSINQSIHRSSHQSLTYSYNHSIDQSIHHWDLTLRELLPFINGVDHVSRIEKRSSLSHQSIKRVINQLNIGQICKIVDIFMFSNQYECTSRVSMLLHSTNRSRKQETNQSGYQSTGESNDQAISQLHRYCFEYVGISAKHCFKIMAQFRRGKTVSEIDQSINQSINPSTHQHVDIRKLVLFGTINQLIQRVHQYPVLVQPHTAKQPVSQSSDSLIDRLIIRCDGRHCMDALCDSLATSRADLAVIIDREPRLAVI